MTEATTPPYGKGDTSYQAAGGIAGIERLVSAFYAEMDTLTAATSIRAMHSDNLDESRRRLSYFLSGWLGGPKLYASHYGSINIPSAHRHLSIGELERDAWLLCMQRAIARQNYSREFGEYLINQLSIPAERIRQRCEIGTKHR